jgi:hypothetical protein
VILLRLIQNPLSAIVVPVLKSQVLPLQIRFGISGVVRVSESGPHRMR